MKTQFRVIKDCGYDKVFCQICGSMEQAQSVLEKWKKESAYGEFSILNEKGELLSGSRPVDGDNAFGGAM